MVKILHLEDNQMGHSGMLSRRLKRKGFESILSWNSEETVKFAHSEQPDLILIDIPMFEVSAKETWTAIQKIKTAEETKNIPIIALIAHSLLSSQKEQTLATGCDDFDTKPIELSRLLEKINRLLPHH